MYEDYSLAELGEVSKGLIRAPKRHPRLRNLSDKRPRAQVRHETQQLRDDLRRANEAKGIGTPFNNYGVPHKVHLDVTSPVTALPYSTRKQVGETVARGAEKVGGQVGTAVGGGATEALSAGGAEFGRQAGHEIKRGSRNVGLSLLGAGAVGGTAFGAVANVRRRRSKKESVKLDRNTGKLVLA